MSGFTTPTRLKAALKIGLYGPPGSGKTFTALLVAEGLACQSGKRVAYVDTEQGTAFYAQPVPQRPVHPEAFDFDVLHSRSITEVLANVRDLDVQTLGIVVIDSITHLWEGCKNAFTGRTIKAGTIPMHAWATIKRPYREMINILLSLPVHVLICGRQGIDYGEDEASGELKALGYKMRAEGDTGYEPDVLIRMESYKANRKAKAVPVAHVEKDRTGILGGRSIDWPGFTSVAEPLLGLLGPDHTAVPSDDAVRARDAEALAREEAIRHRQSADLADRFLLRFAEAETADELKQIGRELTAAVKAALTPTDLTRVRAAYAARLKGLAVPQ